ncbi:MAG: adenylate/guanylate cyclase domain-containing protein [Proteobacteria bacterium]|nr:adenylate/guanylate cyclase domain-containing protein [Pseudomonadota bacterium]
MDHFFSFQSQPDLLGDLQLNDSSIVTNYTTIDAPFPEKVYLVIFAPLNDFIAHLDSILIWTIQITALFLLINLLLLARITGKISTLLLALTRDARQVQEFALNSETKLESRFIEIQQLIEAFSRMKNGLKIFALYTPKTLVRQLIHEATDTSIGGKHQEVSVLCINFGEAAEITTDSGTKEQMSNVSSCFESIHNEVESSKGVIDHYDGDNLHAFWNTPASDSHHEFNACLCIVKMQAGIKILNADQQNKRLPPLKFQFGLHTGEAIAGNIGSPDRVKYTVLGAITHQAKQLEKLNEHYGTSALVSEDITKRVMEGFLIRYVDKIMLRKTDVPTNIYELVGLDPDFTESQKRTPLIEEQIALCRIWKKAIFIYRRKKWKLAKAAFKKVSLRFPDDKLSKIYISRCNKMEVR